MTDVRMRPAEGDECQRRLAEFEVCLETPLIPGEMERWIAAVAASHAALRPSLERQLVHEHPETFAEIAAEDPEMLRRVELLREEDAAIALDLERLQTRIDQLGPAIARIEPDEARIVEALKAFAAEALQFVIRVRTQDVAIRTWLSEALQRDRGLVD